MSRAPPLAGRPPYATDEPDFVYYDSQQSAQRRVRQPPPPNPNDRTSAYNMYDDYLDSSAGNSPNKHAALASAIQPQQLRQQPPTIPLAAPRPGYAAPIAALNMARPAPVVTTYNQQPQPQPQYQPQRRDMQPPHPHQPPRHQPPQPQFPPTSPSSSSPHPLQPPMTPIKPVFVAPRIRDSVKFGNQPSIIRGGSEDTLIPKRRQKRDDFWRRFSMVAKVESEKPQAQKESAWLKKTRSGSSRLSTWVWFIGILFLLCIGGAATLGWWLSHKTAGHGERPKTLGGSENMTLLSSATPIPSSTRSVKGGAAVDSQKVTPTHTVARRTVYPDPVATEHFRAHRHINRRIIH